MLAPPSFLSRSANGRQTPSSYRTPRRAGATSSPCGVARRRRDEALSEDLPLSGCQDASLLAFDLLGVEDAGIPQPGEPLQLLEPARFGGWRGRRSARQALPSTRKRRAHASGLPSLVWKVTQRLEAKRLEACDGEPDENQRGAEALGALRRRPPEDEQQDHGEAGVGDPPRAQPRSHPATQRDRDRTGPGEPGAGDDDDSVSDHRDTDPLEQRGEDVPRGIRGRLRRRRRGQRTNDVVAGESAP